MQKRLTTPAPRGTGFEAATIVGNTPEGQPATFTLDGGDGTTLRGYWVGRCPMDGDTAVTFEADDGQRWVLAWPAA